MLKVLDLFSGIGGFSLGLERTGGFETAAFCEIDEKARRVLRKHWPAVPIFNDVSSLTGEIIRESVGAIDVITGGFPCQDISYAGKGAGLAGERSGLWYEFHRIIKETRPKYAIIENVSALRNRGLDAILWGLSEIGYDAEWHCIPASAVGAPHRRDRIWITAYPARDIADVAHPNIARLEGWLRRILQERPGELFVGESSARGGKHTWQIEPAVGRVADGIPGRVDRIKQLGNAVVPQIPQILGTAILQYELQADQGKLTA